MAASDFPLLRGVDPQQSRVQDNVSNVLRPVAKALQNTPIMGAAPPPWTTVTLLNGFAAVVAAGFFAPAWQVDALGYVHLRGAAISAAGCVAGTVLFLLPIAARPGARKLFASTDGANFGSLGIAPNGEVTTVAILGAGTGLSLDVAPFQVGG